MHESSSQASATLRVLVVDDNIDIAEALASLLEMEGCEARTALTGEEGVRQAQAFQPRLIFLDIGLPGMNGYEVARQIRAAPAGPGMTLVALTGYSLQQDRQKTHEAGFDLHLLKPANLEQIREILRQVQTE